MWRGVEKEGESGRAEEAFSPASPGKRTVREDALVNSFLGLGGFLRYCCLLDLVEESDQSWDAAVEGGRRRAHGMRGDWEAEWRGEDLGRGNPDEVLEYPTGEMACMLLTRRDTILRYAMDGIYHRRSAVVESMRVEKLTLTEIRHIYALVSLSVSDRGICLSLIHI